MQMRWYFDNPALAQHNTYYETKLLDRHFCAHLAQEFKQVEDRLDFSAAGQQLRDIAIAVRDIESAYSCEIVSLSLSALSLCRSSPSLQLLFSAFPSRLVC